jgi:hypothetical protein
MARLSRFFSRLLRGADSLYLVGTVCARNADGEMSDCFPRRDCTDAFLARISHRETAALRERAGFERTPHILHFKARIGELRISIFNSPTMASALLKGLLE